MKTIFGYARVSSCDQNEERQRVALIEAGVEVEKLDKLNRVEEGHLEGNARRTFMVEDIE